MRTFIIVLCIFAFGLCHAADYNVLIYSNKRNPKEINNSLEHWKPDIPDLGPGEVLRDFIVIYRSGNKMVSHALLIDAVQIARVKEYIRAFNGCPDDALMGETCTAPMPQQIYSWWNRTADGVYQDMWNDSDNYPTFKELAEQCLKYPVTAECDGQPCELTVSVKRAKTVYGETIDPQKIRVYQRFVGR